MTPDQATPALMLEAGKRYVRRDGKITSPLHNEGDNFLYDYTNLATYHVDRHGKYGINKSNIDLVARYTLDEDWFVEQCRMIATAEYSPATREADLRRALEDLAVIVLTDPAKAKTFEQNVHDIARKALASAPHSPEGPKSEDVRELIGRLREAAPSMLRRDWDQLAEDLEEAATLLEKSALVERVNAAGPSLQPLPKEMPDWFWQGIQDVRNGQRKAKVCWDEVIEHFGQTTEQPR